MTPPTNPGISAVILTPQTLLTPAEKEIFADMTLDNAWTNRNPRRIGKTGVDGLVASISIPITRVIIKSSTPDSSDVSGTIILIGASYNSNTPLYGINVSPNIDDVSQSATPDFRKSNKLDAANNGKFPNNLVESPVFTDILSEKLSDSSRWDIYTCYWMNLAEDPVNIPAPQFVYLGLSTINALDKGSSLCTPSTIVGKPTDGAHWRAPNHIFGETTAVGNDVIAEKYDYDYNYQTDF